MKLNEAETEKLFSIDDIDTDYMMLDLADAPVSKPEAVIYFGKDGKISGLDTILMSVAVPPPVPGKKCSVTIQYTPKSYDTDVTTDQFTDGVFEADETDDGLIVTTEDLEALGKIISAEFEREVDYPFDNESVHDNVNNTLNRLDFADAIAWYVKEGAAKTTEYKSLYNEYIKEKDKKQSAIKARGGKSNNELLVDGLKKNPYVTRVEVIDKQTARFTKLIRVYTKINKVYDILCNNAGTNYVVKTHGDFGNSVNTGSFMQVISNVGKRITGFIEREKMSKMSNRERHEYNRKKLQASREDDDAIDNDWGSDMDADEEAALGIKESTRFEKEMSLSEAIKILEDQGIRLHELNESEETATIKFSVYLNGEDQPEEKVTCTVQRPLSIANMIADNGDNYDETASEKFTDSVPDIVYNLTGKRCGYHWCFDMTPELV